MNRKRLVLAALLALLVLSIAYAFWAMPRQEQAPPRPAAPRSPAKAKPPGKVSQPAAKATPLGKASQPAANRLHLGLLAQTPQPFPGSGRDIFRFHGGGAPEALVDVAPPVEEAPPPPPSPPPTPEELLRQALSSYRVLGFLEKGGVRSLFVSDGKDVLVIKSGERFGSRGNFIASEITATELVVAQKSDRSVTVRLPLDVSSQEPAIMAPTSVPRPEVEAAPTPPSSPIGRRSRVRPGYGGEAAVPEEAPQPEGVPQSEEAPQTQEAPQPNKGAPDADAAVKEIPSGDEE
jgi:hypothetical protein